MAKILVNGQVKVYQSPGSIVYHELETSAGLWVRKAVVGSFKEVLLDGKVVGVNYGIQYVNDFPDTLKSKMNDLSYFCDPALTYEVDAETVIPKPIEVKMHEAKCNKETTPEGDRAGRRDWR